MVTHSPIASTEKWIIGKAVFSDVIPTLHAYLQTGCMAGTVFRMANIRQQLLNLCLNIKNNLVNYCTG